MGRAALLSGTPAARRPLAGLLAILLTGATCATAGEDARATRGGVAVRIVDAGEPLGSERIRSHLAFAVEQGFNAVWVRAPQAGAWTVRAAGQGPQLREAFLKLAGRCEERGVRIFVELRPVQDAADGFVFSDPAGADRIADFLGLLRRRAGVRDFVLSFEEAPLRLSELADVLTFGPIAASAHVELARETARRLPRGTRLWLRPAVASDARLDDPSLRYPAELLHSLPRLPRRVGLVWHGPRAAAPAITAEDLARTRLRLGRRRLVLDDRFPDNASGPRMPLALVLGPLRQRDPAIARQVAAWRARPMAELGASRLALSTVADFLRDPRHYDAERSWQAAIRRLAGDRAETLEALRTQAAEWGGWIGGANYHTALDDNPEVAAHRLRDPAAVAAWSWTVRTYPARMQALALLPDETFRDELLTTMGRRLAVARAAPLARDLVQGRVPDAATAVRLERELRRQRAALDEQPEIAVALDLFLRHAGLRPGVSPSPPPPAAGPHEEGARP